MRPRPQRRCSYAAAAAALLAMVACVAHAAPAPQGVPWVSVRMPSPSAAGAPPRAHGEEPATKLANRLDGELRALGFWPAVTADTPGPADDALLRGALAEILVANEGAETWRVELRLVDRFGNRQAQTERVPAHADAVAVLAVRIVETLRSHLELPARPLPETAAERDTPPRAPPRPAVTAQAPGPAPHEEAHQVGIAVGLAAIASARGGGAGWAPTVALEWQLRATPLRLGLAAVGLGGAMDITTASGTARIWQDMAMVCGTWVFRRGGRVSPAVGFGVGALWWHGEGQSFAPAAQGVRADGVSAAADAGLSVDVRGGRHWGIRAAAHVLGTYPATQFRLLQTADAVIGGPSLWTNVAVFITL